jgi:VWFA-related protein
MTQLFAAVVGLLIVLTPPQFKSRVDVVRVDVLVTAGGKPVSGLTAADFELRDNGVAQQVRLSDASHSHLDVILALDMSASLTAERLAQLRAASEALLTHLRPEDRAALVTFDHAVVTRQELSSDVEQVRRALRQPVPGGRTSLVDAMYAGLIQAEGGERRSLLIAFSDGVDTSSWLEPATVIQVARQSATVVYGVSTAWPPPALLERVASETGGEVLDASSRRLDRAFTDILAEFRQRYLLTFSPEPPPSAGWHTLEIRVKRGRANVKARPGYFVAPKS